MIRVGGLEVKPEARRLQGKFLSPRGRFGRQKEQEDACLNKYTLSLTSSIEPIRRVLSFRGRPSREFALVPVPFFIASITPLPFKEKCHVRTDNRPKESVPH